MQRSRSRRSIDRSIVSNYWPVNRSFKQNYTKLVKMSNTHKTAKIDVYLVGNNIHKLVSQTGRGMILYI